MGAISFDEFYGRFMSCHHCAVAYGDDVRIVANIIAGGVALAPAGIALGRLYAQFSGKGLSLDCFLVILAGLEAAGRVHDRGDGVIMPGFPVPGEGRHDRNA